MAPGYQCVPWVCSLCPQCITGFMGVFVFVFLAAQHFGCRILVPQPGTEPGLSTVKSQGPNHWTARELSIVFTLKPVSESKCGRWGFGGKKM